MKMFLLMHRFNVFEFKIWIQSKINMASFFLLFSGVISYTEYLFLLCILTSKYFGKRKNPSLQILKFQIYCYILGFFCPLLHIPILKKKMYQASLYPFEPALSYRILCYALSDLFSRNIFHWVLKTLRHFS